MQELADKPNPPTKEADFLPLNGTDYVEFYAGNAKQAEEKLRYTPPPSRHLLAAACPIPRPTR